MLGDAQEHARELRESLLVWLTPKEFKAVVEDARDGVGPRYGEPQSCRGPET